MFKAADYKKGNGEKQAQHFSRRILGAEARKHRQANQHVAENSQNQRVHKRHRGFRCRQPDRKYRQAAVRIIHLSEKGAAPGRKDTSQEIPRVNEYPILQKLCHRRFLLQNRDGNQAVSGKQFSAH